MGDTILSPTPTQATAVDETSQPAAGPKTSVAPQLTVSVLIATIYAGAHWATWKLGMDTVFSSLITTDSALMLLLANYWMGGSYGSDKKTTSMLNAVSRQIPPAFTKTP